MYVGETYNHTYLGDLPSLQTRTQRLSLRHLRWEEKGREGKRREEKGREGRGKKGQQWFIRGEEFMCVSAEMEVVWACTFSPYKPFNIILSLTY